MERGNRNTTPRDNKSPREKREPKEKRRKSKRRTNPRRNGLENDVILRTVARERRLLSNAMANNLEMNSSSNVNEGSINNSFSGHFSELIDRMARSIYQQSSNTVRNNIRRTVNYVANNEIVRNEFNEMFPTVNETINNNITETPSFNENINMLSEVTDNLGQINQEKYITNKYNVIKTSSEKLCTICDEKKICYMTSCCHLMCTNCFYDWFVKNAKKTCPVCRENIEKKSS